MDSGMVKNEEKKELNTGYILKRQEGVENRGIKIGKI